MVTPHLLEWGKKFTILDAGKNMEQLELLSLSGKNKK
jgi:hypothetical protein